MAELTGFDGELRWTTSKPNGQPRRKLETSRAEELFGFRARTTLRDGLERTIAWYREHALAPADAWLSSPAVSYAAFPAAAWA